jgi:CrcB protein
VGVFFAIRIGGYKMKKYVYVGSFGFLGAILRFTIKNIKIKDYTGQIPINTLIINVTGSFFLALILTLTLEVYKVREEVKLGLTTGLLGTYTTFSSLCREEVNLILNGNYYSAFTYILMSLLFSSIAIFIAITISKVIARKRNDANLD